MSAARDGSGDVRAGRRRHGRVPAAPAQEEEGNGVGKLESGARKLTAQSIWTEEGRERKIDGEAELRREAAMAAGGAGADSARYWLERARERVEEAKGEAREALVRRIEAGW